jgi:hypothetical protein
MKNRLIYRGMSFFFVAILALLFGCVSSKQYRTDYESTSNNPQSVIEETNNYTLGFVEFDDQGWLWNRRQIDTVTSRLHEKAKNEGLLIITFVHGWKHNADNEDGNVKMMRKVLLETVAIEKLISKKQGHVPRSVVGVYIGWRGLSENLEPFKEMSFWGRKNTAEVVGHGAVVELLTELENLKNQSNKEYAGEITNHQRLSTKLIIIGHSFGGDIVYSATAPILAERMVENLDPNSKPQPPKSLGDLVVLINPAFEAARFETLQRLATTEQFPSGNNCTLAVFTSKTDNATKTAFPLGRSVSTLFDSHRDHEQKKANVTAVGHYTPYIAYDLNVRDTDSKKKSLLTASNNVPVETSVERILAIREQRHRTSSKTLLKDLTNTFTRCVLEPRTNCIANNPVFVVSVDSRIIPNHGDIDNWIFRRFLGEFLFAFSNDDF